MFHAHSLADYGPGAVHDVVWLIHFRGRFWRSVGMGLAVCGAVMQAVVKNSLADPYVLGISSGATLGATLAIMLGVGTVFGSNFVGVMAFFGALVASFPVLGSFQYRREADAAKLVLPAWRSVRSVPRFPASPFISPTINGASQAAHWTMGSLSAASWEDNRVILPVILVGSLVFWTQFRNLNLMLLGDETSVTRGRIFTTCGSVI